MKGAATWISFTLAAASAVWGGEAPVSPGKNPPKVGGEVEISSLPFDLNEVIRTVRKNRGLPEESPRHGFRAEARGERPFVSKGNAFSHETPRFQAEIGEDGLRYFAQGNKEKPDFEILSVSFERGGVPQTVFGKGRIEERVPGLLQGETRDGVTPYVRNRGGEGVEMYWVVEENVGRGLLTAPSGGDTVPALQVIFTVRAAGEPREHPGGLIFPTWEGSGQVTLSNVTVVDAAGRREEIHANVGRGLRPRRGGVVDPALQPYEIVFTISEKFLASAQYPILIDPTVGPEFPVEPSLVIGLAAHSQWAPSVASNGTDYFVAWEDYRRGLAPYVYGTRVASDGTVLDPVGIAVPTVAGVNPSIASNGTDYFVAWQDWRSGVNWDIYGTRVASDGTVLDPAGVAVSTAANLQEYPSVASNGADYFVAWEDNRSGADYDIHGARVRASDGLLLDGPPDTGGIAVSTAVDDQGLPSVASNGTDYFVAWQDWRNSATTDCDIYGARVQASDGLLLDGPPDTGGIAVSTVAIHQEYPSVASNGTDYFVAWRDWRNWDTTDYDIYGARVASDGTVLDPSGIAVSTAAWDQLYPSVASNGADYFIVWHDNRSGWNTDYNIYGARVASDGTVLDPSGIAVSTAANSQYVPSVASNGTNYFVAWEDSRSGDWDVYGTRVAPDGTVLDPLGIAVSTAANNQEVPSVASNGTDYFVAWMDFRSGANDDIYGARVASDGTVLDPLGIAVSTAASYQLYPSVTSNGTDYFVVWEDYRNGNRDIYGARVRASDGLLLDGPPDTGGIAVSTAANNQYEPSVASNGTDYFVAWHEWRSGPADIYGARVTSAGAVLDPAGIAVSTAASGQYDPSVASNGTDYFVAWGDGRNDFSDIYGTRVASDGTVLDPAGIAVSTAASGQYDPSAASNGTDYFVAWEDRRNGFYDIYGARVASSDGTVLDATGILIQESLNDDQAPAVAYSACGKYLLAYYRFNDDPNFQSQRVMARTIQGSSQEPPDIIRDISFDPLLTLTELCGDSDLLAEPGEEWQVTVGLLNDCGAASNVTADLTINAGSSIQAGVCNNPGYYGDMPAGGKAQFTYSFVVDAGAVCVNDITFDVTNIASDEGAYPDEIAAFNVQVGQAETGTQVADPLTATNETISSDFAPPFSIAAPAASASLSYTLTGTTDLVNCVEVALIDPFAKATVVKPLGEVDINPYDVTAFYTGIGTYQLRLMEEAKGCGGGGYAQIASGTLSVIECHISACVCPLLPPSEPSPVGSPDPLLIPTTVADQIIVEDVENETGYVVYEEAIGAWYGTPSQTCLDTWNDVGSTVELGYSIIGPGNRWVVVSAANAAGESSCGMDSAGAERNAQPGWPAPGPCP